MTKSLLIYKTFLALALLFSLSQNVKADSCTDAVCGAICAKAPFGSGTICKGACPTVGSSAISTGCKSEDPCTGICSKMPSSISGFCKTACTKAGSTAIKSACQKCAAADSNFLFEDDQPTL